MTLDDLRREPTIYLLPESGSRDEAIEYLRNVCGAILEEQLDGWYRVPAVWPTDRDLTKFRHWFDCSLHSMIVDLCDAPLEREDF